MGKVPKGSEERRKAGENDRTVAERQRRRDQDRHYRVAVEYGP